MSIIQEALKKAQNKAGSQPEARSPLASQPVDVKPAATSSPASPLPSPGVPHKGLLLAGLFVIGVIAGVVFVETHKAPPKQVPVAPENGTPSGATAPAARRTDFGTEKSVDEKVGDMGVLKAIPDVKIAAEKPKFVVNGIMYVEGNPRAIINDYVVREGDTVDGAFIVKISPDSVIVRQKDAEKPLYLKK
jgi:hypothetical protein